MTVKKAYAWDYAWASMDTGMNMQVHVHVQLYVRKGHNPWHTVGFNITSPC